MKISSDDLRAFLALAEERSFTRAAARCHKSQSAFSARIRSLEATLGAQLFDRTTRSVELTVEGELFEESARQLYGEFADMVRNFSDYAARRKGRVTIAALPSLAADWIPRMFAELREMNPGIELNLLDTMSEASITVVRTGQADLAVTSATTRADDLESLVLGVERFFLVARKGHPLLERPLLSSTDLEGAPFLHMARGSSVREQVETALHPINVMTIVEASYLATVAGMAAAGLGVTVVPSLTLVQFRNPELGARPLDFPGLTRPISLVRRRGRSSSVAAKAVHAHLLRERGRIEGLLPPDAAVLPGNAGQAPADPERISE